MTRRDWRMSPVVYRDIDVLVRRGLRGRRVVDGQSWRWGLATDCGHDRARALQSRAGPDESATVTRLRAMRRLTDPLDFARLLATIYARYPGYAARSVFRRP